MPAITGRTIIPVPDNPQPVSGAYRLVLAVEVSTVTVAYSCDCTSITFSIIGGPVPWASELNQSINQGRQPGEVVVLTVDLEEGGTIFPNADALDGAAEWFPTILVAIPHLYLAISDTDQRNGLRMIYTRLARQCAALTSV